MPKNQPMNTDDGTAKRLTGPNRTRRPGTPLPLELVQSIEDCMSEIHWHIVRQQSLAHSEAVKRGIARAKARKTGMQSSDA